MTNDSAVLREKILELTRDYAALEHRANLPGDDGRRPMFRSGADTVPYAGRVFDVDEVEAGVAAMLDFWLTLGPHGEKFESELASWLGVKHSLLVNSGSSANLVAVSSLTTHKLPPERRIVPGDEIITAAAGFPTTVAPIVQVGAIPVFLDNDPITGNIRCEALEEAFVAGKTKAVIIAHTLGNPFDLGEILEFCHRNNLWLIEDNCDALGSTYSLPKDRAHALGITENSPGIPDDGHHVTRFTGTWGDLSTQSFYPPHHITLGEGGAVNIVKRPALKLYAESFRDWGRDCWCPSGKDNTCNKRFGWKLGQLPEGYDHKYTYSHLGYNLKPLDTQAAIGRRQLKRLPHFTAKRKQNWQYLRQELASLVEFFEFSLPTHGDKWGPEGFSWDQTECKTDCSWFGFMMSVRKSAPFSSVEFASYLDEKRIGNRMLFGGNLVRQPAFLHLKERSPEAFRVVGPLDGANRIMEEAIFLGTYPGLTSDMLTYVVETVHQFVKNKCA